MKKMLITICGLLALVLVNQASAVPTLSLSPASQTASNGDTVYLDLIINGLGDYAPDSLGDFDVDISYDAAVLSFQNYSLDVFLGDEFSGEAIDFSLGDLGGGIVNIAELSLLEPDAFTCLFCIAPFLDDIQPSSFSLATLEFHVDALSAGSSTTVGIDTVYVLGDGYGLPLTLGGTSDAVIRAPSSSVPEPTTLALLSLGLFGRGAVRRKKAA